ncbi:MAG: hypothetical protein M3P44_03685 [Actinomycetota bacterium]|nr:hypothetical protein [Actinomycetota bacterium]MDP9344815.1 hypothetical protein [Actinomycetota bacterium]
MESSVRLLVVAPAAVNGLALRVQVERRTGERTAQVHLVCPAVVDSKVKYALGDVDDAIADADARLAESVEGLQSERVAASGVVGDADPLIALEDALGTFPADEVLIVTHRGAEAEWFEQDLFERAAERLKPPVAHVELGAGNGDGQLAEVERSEAGIPPDEPGEDEMQFSANMPPFTRRDLAGIIVAIVGTVVLAILAANPPGGTDSFGGAARILIAMAFALLNLAHVVGLVLFNSQRYRGAGQTLFGNLSLFGTPLAIVVSALLGYT